MQKSSYFAEIICILGTILIMYGFGMFNFYLFSTIIAIIYYKLKNKHIVLSYPKVFFIYISVFFICRTLHLKLDDIPFGTLLMIFFLGFFQGQSNLQILIKIYRAVANINVVMFVLQSLTKLMIGYSIPGVLFFLPVSQFEDAADIQDKMIYTRERFSGFFSEPAHLAVFLLPLIAIELFYSQDKYSKLRAVIYLVIILLSQSGSGLFGIIVVALFYIFRKLKDSKASTVLPSIFVFSVFLSSVAYVALNTDYGASIISRQTEITTDEESSSGYVRVVRGYYLIDMMTPTELLIGTSDDTVKEYAYKSPYFYGYNKGDMIYINFFQRLIVYGGLVTTFLFFFFAFVMYKHVNYAGKCCLGILITMAFMVAMNFSPDMLLQLTTIFLLSDDKKLKIKTIRM